MVIPSPFVYWAQTENVVTLRVDLKNVNNPDVKVLENNVKFSAEGTGARGVCQYEFSLDLFDSVKAVSCRTYLPRTAFTLTNFLDGLLV